MDLFWPEDFFRSSDGRETARLDFGATSGARTATEAVVGVVEDAPGTVKIEWYKPWHSADMAMMLWNKNYTV